MNNAIVAVTGDLHVNSTVALCPPRVPLDDGGEYVASKVQRWIWAHWKTYWNAIAEVKENTGYPVFCILNGELLDDLKHTSTQLVSRNLSDQIHMSHMVLQQTYDIVDHYIVCRGTEAHVGPSACLDEMVAEDIGAIMNSDGVKHSWWNFVAEVAGVKFDVAHHAGMGHARPWTKGGDANRLAATIIYRYAEMWKRPPNLVFRAHNHKPVDSYDNHMVDGEPVRAIITPSWQLSTSFGHRLGGDRLPIGGTYTICEDGNYKVHKMIKQYPMERPWKTNDLNLQKTN